MPRERSIRYLPGRFDAYYSAKEAGKNHRLEAILYPNSLVTVKTLPLPEEIEELENVTITKYTKHYYIGSERVASALGSIKSLGLLCEQIGADAALIQTMNNKVEIAEDFISKVYHTFEKDLELTAPFLYNDIFWRCDPAHNQDMYHPYWYHPNHLGSSSYITNLDGEINQHLEYLPFGETLVEEHLNSNNSPFKFNAKELDAETGNYYYVSRYYDPKWSIWLSVDPLAEFYPGWSPYAYTYHNPVRWTDSTGMCPDGDCPEIANDGDMHTASDGNTYVHQFGRWSDAPVTDLGNVSDNKGGERESVFEGKFKAVGPAVYLWTELTVNGKEGSGYWETNNLKSDYFGGWGLGDIGGGDLRIEINPCYLDTNSLVDLLNSATQLESQSIGFGFWNGATFIGMDDDGNVIYTMTNGSDDFGWNTGVSPSQTSKAPNWGDSRYQIPMSERDSIKQRNANIKANRGDISKYKKYKE